MAGKRALLLTVCVLLFGVSSAHAYSEGGLPSNEITYQFKGLAGNTGGIESLMGRYRRDWIEVGVGNYNGEFTAEAAARLDLNTTSVIVPHGVLGVVFTPNLALMPGLGVEFLTPAQLLGDIRIGFRINAYATLWFSKITYINNYVTMGATCHF